MEIVIKVKYGDTLRRFNAHVVDQELALNMDGLREKILSLFTFSHDTELTLTYIDEDGDVVTLVDDEDLCDVVRQALNPLRITVKLNAEKSSRRYSRSSGSSTPLRSPGVQPPFQMLKSNISEILKSVPEPLSETLTKLSTELESKAPGIAELVDSFSKVGLSAYRSKLSESQISGSTTDATKTKDADCSNVAPVTTDFQTISEEPSLRSYKDLPKRNPELIQIRAEEIKHDKVILEKGSPEEVNKPSVSHLGPKPPNVVGFIKHPDSVNWSSPNDGIKKVFHSGIGKSRDSHFDPSFIVECPFTGIPLRNDFDMPPQSGSHGFPFKRNNSQRDSNAIFHRGIVCDGCGVHPITGIRFKSRVKEDYDLCSTCFGKMGNDTDYISIDRPLAYRHSSSFKGPRHSHEHSPTIPPFFRGCKGSAPLKLDSRFIQDVNILDGTIVAPLTPFTKIWRMRNSGTLVWPQNTKLVWIGGDRLGDACSVEVEIPAAGLAVDQELDVSVDFVAPELPGRYISYWRMASPSGQKFGQRVWALIQVDTSPTETLHEIVPGLNLNLPPVSNGPMCPEIIKEDANPVVDKHHEPDNSNKTSESGQQVVELQPNTEQDVKFPTNNSLFVGSGESSSVPSAPPSGSYPIIDLSGVDPALAHPTPLVPSAASTAVINAQASAQGVMEINEVEEKLLRELEDMGFKQVDLNKEVLRTNDYDLEQSVDDLCGVFEWDPILEELQEMGFQDTEVNKKLLKKNNGSIKRVVMDLITGEREFK